MLIVSSATKERKKTNTLFYVCVCVCFRTDGYIVCEEHEEILRAAWVEEQELQKQKEKEVWLTDFVLLCFFYFKLI